MITQKQGPSDFCVGSDDPCGFCYPGFLERRCLTAFRSPVFDTTSPGDGRPTETTHYACHGNLTPPRIAPSRPQAGVSLCTDEVIAKQPVTLFYGRTGIARRLIWPSLMGKSPQAGLGAFSKVALRLPGASSGNVFQFPDMTAGQGWRCFSRSSRGQRTTPSLLKPSS